MYQIQESFKVALNAIWLNRTRAVLTMLGIIIGISSVVVMVSLGQGVEDFIISAFEGLGADQITVSSSEPDSDTRTRIEPLTLADVESLKNQKIAPHITDAGALYSLNATIVANGENTTTSVRGVTTNMNVVEDWDVAEGEYISQTHIDNRDRVVLLGRDLVETLYGSDQVVPIGDIIRINEQTFEVIGIMESIGSGTGTQDSSAIIPITTAQSRLGNARVKDGYEVSTIYIQVLDQNDTTAAIAEITAYFYRSHSISTPDEADFTITDSSDLLSTVSSIVGLLTIFLAVVAGISLFVGGIGIMNIMLVSVTERTREIGLRKAVGARPFDILVQFLMESLIIAMVGGAIGVLIAFLLTLVGSQIIEGLTLVIDGVAVIVASLVSMIVGIVFGILPANSAARMHPIDALRFE